MDAIHKNNNEIIVDFIPDLGDDKIFNNIKGKIKKVYKYIKDKNISYNLFEQLILFQHLKKMNIFQKAIKK